MFPLWALKILQVVFHNLVFFWVETNIECKYFSSDNQIVTQLSTDVEIFKPIRKKCRFIKTEPSLKVRQYSVGENLKVSLVYSLSISEPWYINQSDWNCWHRRTWNIFKNWECLIVRAISYLDEILDRKLYQTQQ